MSALEGVRLHVFCDLDTCVSVSCYIFLLTMSGKCNAKYWCLCSIHGCCGATSWVVGRRGIVSGLGRVSVGKSRPIFRDKGNGEGVLGLTE